MCCSVIQCVAVCCNVLRGTVLKALWLGLVRTRVLQRDTVCCSMLQCVVMCCEEKVLKRAALIESCVD